MVKTQRFFKVVLWKIKITEIFQNGEKCGDFSKWFHCNGQPTQMEDEKSFQTHYLRVKGSEAHSKRDRVRKRSSRGGQELEGALKK
jgi:hypothetical protein